MLEIGAGLGATTRTLREDSHRSWLCLEPDATLAERHRQEMLRPPTPNSPVETRAGTVATLSANEQFDTILYVDVLEHIEDDRRELAAAAAHMRPGAHLVVLGPAHQRLFSPFDAAIGHFRRYDARSLRTVGPENLKLVHDEYLDAAGMLLNLGNRLLLRSTMPTRNQIAFWNRFVVPVSRVVDPLTARRVGKTILAVWQRPIPRSMEHIIDAVPR